MGKRNEESVLCPFFSSYFLSSLSPRSSSSRVVVFGSFEVVLLQGVDI